MNTKGFTLIEILAAVMIIAIGLAPVVKTLPEGLKSLRLVERNTKAVFLAQDKIDEVRSRILGDNTSYGFNKSGGYTETGNFSYDADYCYAVTDDMGSSIKEISVTVWFDEDGDGAQDASEEAVRLDTKIAER